MNPSPFFLSHLNLPKQGLIIVNGIFFFLVSLNKFYLDSNNNNKKWSQKGQSYSSGGYH